MRNEGSKTTLGESASDSEAEKPPSAASQRVAPNLHFAEEQNARSEMLLGSEAMQKLAAAKVAVFGVGGVGGACAEALARSGIGAIDLYDNDKISATNLNRQIVALHSTIGMYKVDVMAKRIRDINPECQVGAHKIFYLPDSADSVDLSAYDYVVDAIDTVAGKVELVVRSKAAGVKIICSMGAGNRLDPLAFVVTDIGKTEGDPLAKAVRKELRACGVTDVKAVWSKEQPRHPDADHEPSQNLRRSPASCSFVPPVCGLILAAEVVKDLVL
jgi:tRNA A37 threonylcarbamoyladenosine dehydratase